MGSVLETDVASRGSGCTCRSRVGQGIDFSKSTDLLAYACVCRHLPKGGVKAEELGAECGAVLCPEAETCRTGQMVLV